MKRDRYIHAHDQIFPRCVVISIWLLSLMQYGICLLWFCCELLHCLVLIRALWGFSLICIISYLEYRKLKETFCFGILDCFTLFYWFLVSFKTSILVTSEYSYPETEQKKWSIIQNRFNHTQIKKRTACLTPILAFPVHIHLQIHTGILKVVNTVDCLWRIKQIQIYPSISERQY